MTNHANNAKRPLRVAIIGTARRSDYLYGPLLAGMPDKAELVAVWGRSVDSARRLGESLGVPWYTDLDKLIRDTAPEIGIVSVAYDANGEVGLMAVEAGLHVLLETPIAHKLSEADAIIQAAARNGAKIEVSEQFHRRPLEAIKLALIRSGLFGRVYTSFNDFAGHGYHGVSVMRSYLGFDAAPVRVIGAVKEYELAATGRGWRTKPRRAVKRRSTVSSSMATGGLASTTGPTSATIRRCVGAAAASPGREGHGHYRGRGVGCGRAAELGRSRRRGALFHHAGAALGARRRRRADCDGGAYGRSRPAHRALG